MCGVTALLRSRSEAALEPDRSRRRIEAMTRSLAHRGPDGDGFFVGPHAVLGHRRLAVLDLVTGDQPMSSADGRIQVVFNGEIFNHHELRAELEAAGCEFRTRSDTEVLVHGFREWGQRLPERLIGFFVVFAHDTKTGETLIARDHVGKKPLFWAESDGVLLFASEARALLGVEGLDFALDDGALREFLALRYVPGGRTLLDGLHEFEPAHVALHRAGEPLRPRRYWTPEFGTAEPGDDVQVADSIRRLLTTCIGARLEADVPLGAFLSGGVDSSAIVHGMTERAAGRVQAVTVGFEEAKFDERPFAREFAARHGIELIEEVCRPDPNADLPQLAEILDLPQTDDSIWPTWLVCRAARRHVTVALSGDGGDETFAGYRRYRFDVLENRLRSWLPRRPAHLLSLVTPKGDWLPRPLRFKRTFQNLARDPAEAYFRSVSGLLPEEVGEMLLGDVGACVDPFRGLRAVYDASRAPDHGSRVLDLDLRTYLPGDILTKVDRCSMAVSLEVRSPLLDRRVIEAAAALPMRFKVDGAGGKKVLKRALEPWLGRSWMDRPKQGFSIPLADWLRGPLRAVRDDALHGDFARRFFDPVVMQRWCKEHDAGRRDRSEALWAALILHVWNERWGRQA